MSSITFTVSMSEEMYKSVIAFGKLDGKNRSQAIQALVMRGFAHMNIFGTEDVDFRKDPITLLRLTKEEFEKKLAEKTTLEDYSHEKE